MVEPRRPEYVLIGPVCAGKTTLGARLAERLGVEHVQLDSIANDYYRIAPGWDADTYNALMADSFVAAYRHFEPALAFAVESVVRDHHDCIFDLGAGHTSFLDRRLHERVVSALSPFSNVVLLLPSADTMTSVRTLWERCRQRGHTWIHDGVDFIEHWVTDDQNRRLADRVLFTEDRDPDALVEEILLGESTS
ncbi:shikimate kinase [Actinopolymorpha cephalotaxi]|uniref:Shikimate kinase n=1 Tax=Actinopolymorpha cephalotaxi TaxID=504797 RepID=A0A1I2LRP9_9ACTN|nr:AAA family ATPase [Actinopolymorpha cephalotaxi]NYH81430.1 shikimate kinase [Actinopolymorpha cephalotaxi]SFF82142.1 shikimate kinase [Actinopolymorpha cephalotaxi]